MTTKTEDKNEMREELVKSIDSYVDTLFEEETTEEATTTEEEVVEKSKNAVDEIVGEPKQSSKMKSGSDAAEKKMKADDGEQPKKSKKEKDGENGRPKQISDVPEVDEDGNRAKGYESVQKENSVVPSSSAKGTIVKSEQMITMTVAEYESLKKSSETVEESNEEMKKADKEEANQEALIKSAIESATKGLKEENESLKKSLTETQEIVNKIANKPNQQKSIANVQALEKSFGENAKEDNEPKQEAFSKADLLDAAEDLVKSKKLTTEHVIELENTGYIFDAEARRILETSLRKK